MNLEFCSAVTMSDCGRDESPACDCSSYGSGGSKAINDLLPDLSLRLGDRVTSA